jgi:Calcineurin-like phosphoesterase
MRPHLRLFALLALFVCGGVLSQPSRAQTSALAPLPGTGTLSPSHTDTFTFVAAGDNRPDTSGAIQQAATPKQIFCAVRALKPVFVMWTGDTISGKDPKDETLIQQQYAEFFRIAQTGRVPVFNAPGNHELDNKQNVPNAKMQQWYEQTTQTKSYGSFDYGNAHFVALNTDDLRPSTGKKKHKKKNADLDTGYVGQAQLEWLKADLKANEDKAHIFIFMHRPIKPYQSKDGLDGASAAALQKLFAKRNNISYVVAGHEHMYYNPQSKSGFGQPPARTDPAAVPPYYLVSGGAGAPLKGSKDKHPPAGSFYHYLVFSVQQAQVSVQLIKVAAAAPTCQ